MIQCIAPYHGYQIFEFLNDNGIAFEIRNYCGRNITGLSISQVHYKIVINVCCSRMHRASGFDYERLMGGISAVKVASYAVICYFQHANDLAFVLI